MSEQMPLIHDALASVMADVDHVAKRDRNEHQRFLFRGIDAVVNAVGPALRKHSVVVVPRIQHVDYELVHTSTGKPATACRVIVTYAFFATDGSSIEATVAGEAWDSGDKATPKAMSVAFRTALLQALALPTDEPDPDASAYAHEQQSAPQAQPQAPTKKQPKATKKAVQKIQILANELGLNRDQKLTGVAVTIGREVESTNDLTPDEATQVIESLTATKKAREAAARSDDGDTESDDK